MFTHSLDNKPTIVDDIGNKIKDLTKSIFSRKSGPVDSYSIKKMSTRAVMRPDIVSLGEYGTTEYAEYILKYSGVSNPFTLGPDDILLIPDDREANMAMVDNNPDEPDSIPDDSKAVKNYFKFVNQDYKKDKTSYDNLANLEVKKPNIKAADGTLSGDFYVPYIALDNTTAITIRNGRVFFGTDSGIPTNEMITAATTNLDEKIQALIDSTGTALSDKNCMYNGNTLADFIKSTMKKN